jgi:hypothetical protein
MPIRPFLSGQPFDQEAITAMSQALERVCDALRLKMIDDSATRLEQIPVDFTHSLHA